MLLLCLFFLVVSSSKVPFFEVHESSAYNTGYVIGQRFRERIHQGIAIDTYLPQLLKWVATPSGSKDWEDILSVQKNLYPEYYEELKGIADGSGEELLKIALTQLEWDLAAWNPTGTRKKPSLSSTRCSDVLLGTRPSSSSPPTSLFSSHNEDSDGGFDGLCYLIRDSVRGYTAFVYPGELAGNAFGWNDHGITVTVNQLSPNQVNTSGVGFYFISRDILKSRTFEEAIWRATRYPCFYGFSAQIGSVSERKAVNLEVWNSQHVVTSIPYSSVAVTATLPHFNAYLHLNVPQSPTPSSAARMERFRELLPKSEEEVLEFLSDQKNSSWPVYRNGGVDGEKTLATVVFDFVKNIATIYEGKPAETEPVYLFKIKK